VLVWYLTLYNHAHRGSVSGGGRWNEGEAAGGTISASDENSATATNTNTNTTGCCNTTSSSSSSSSSTGSSSSGKVERIDSPTQQKATKKSAKPVSKSAASKSTAAKSAQKSKQKPSSFLKPFALVRTASSDSNNTIDPVHRPKKQRRETPTPPPPSSPFQVLSFNLSAQGLKLVRMREDGNCLFRAMALQLYGDVEMHDLVRSTIMQHITHSASHFSPFTSPEPIQSYVRRKKQLGVHGNQVEIQAASEVYCRRVEVFREEDGGRGSNIFMGGYDEDETNTLNPNSVLNRINNSNNNRNNNSNSSNNNNRISNNGNGTHSDRSSGNSGNIALRRPPYSKVPDNPPLRLSYHNNNHYNSVIDPNLPTAGVGLGLPDLVPGLADRRQVDEARMLSDLEQDRLLNEEVVRRSELEETQREIERRVLAESLQEYTRGVEKNIDFGVSDAGSWSSGGVNGENGNGNSNSNGNGNGSEKPSSPAMKSKRKIVPKSGGETSPRKSESRLQFADQYPTSVQELISNGFPSDRVLRAYDLVGDNLDELLLLLMG